MARSGQWTQPPSRAMSLPRRPPRTTAPACPPATPSHGAELDSGWRQWLPRWLRGAPADMLQQVRRAFDEALAGLDGEDVVRLRNRVRRCLQLQDLWHLRSALFDLVARRGGEQEARRRLVQLDRHFPARRSTR